MYRSCKAWPIMVQLTDWYWMPSISDSRGSSEVYADVLVVVQSLYLVSCQPTLAHPGSLSSLGTRLGTIELPYACCLQLYSSCLHCLCQQCSSSFQGVPTQLQYLCCLLCCLLFEVSASSQ